MKIRSIRKILFSIIIVAGIGAIALLVNVGNSRAAKCTLVEGNQETCVDWTDSQDDCEAEDNLYSPTDECRYNSVWCFCSDNVSDIKENNYTTAETAFVSTCERALACNEDAVKRTGGKKYFQCRRFGGDAPSETVCKAAKTDWEEQKAAAIQKFSGYVSGQKAGGMLSKIIPGCALRDDQGPESACRDVTIFVAMGINVASYLFGIIGALALLMFIYGGFILVLSGGNPEKVKKGGTILLSALIGLIIVFGAYMLVQFLGEAIGVKENLL